MRVSHLRSLLKETGLSPEQLGERIQVSGMTVRRMLRKPNDALLPEAYHPLVRQGVFGLIIEGRLQSDSPLAREFVSQRPSLSFDAAIHALGFKQASMAQGASHQEQVLIGLSEIGASSKHQTEVQQSKKEISRFRALGAEWAQRVNTLVKVLRSRKLNQMEKLAAYGALFYLITVFDLIPDTIPVFGMLDDFAILGIVAAYYVRKFPGQFRVDS